MHGAGGLLLFDWGVFDPVKFELSDKVLFQSGVSLGVGVCVGGGCSGVR